MLGSIFLAMSLDFSTLTSVKKSPKFAILKPPDARHKFHDQKFQISRFGFKNVSHVCLYLQAYIQNLVENGPVVSEKRKLKIHLYTTLGQGQEMTLTFNTHISSLKQLV